MTGSTIHLCLIGPGLVGSEFIRQIHAHQCHSKLFQVVAITNSRRQVISPSIDLNKWNELLLNSSQATDLKGLAEFVSKEFPNCVMIDCTSSDSVASMYLDWIRLGLHIITPNKKAFSGNLDYFNQLKSESLKYHVCLYHESTVGAGLPIISTIKDLVSTGDEIYKIEGILSGTLSFLFNTFSKEDANLSFSDVVALAKEKGYTEPDPRDDLNGMDVGRKAVILGRLIGLDLDLSTLNVQNISPRELDPVQTATEYMEKLPNYNEFYHDLNQKAIRNEQVLRYVATIDPKGESSVSLKGYPKTHLFGSLEGSDNVISIQTKRFPNGLLIQGAGAGAAVTAFGMFSDLLKVVNKLVK